VAIAGLLANPACRLLTLTGVGGIGKTRLALAAAERAPEFRDGVHYVPLVGVASPDLLATAVMDALEVTRYGDAPPEEQLVRYVRDKEMLLMLDNFEHLMESASLVIAGTRA
jgi:predicted ATPase